MQTSDNTPVRSIWVAAFLGIALIVVGVRWSEFLQFQPVDADLVITVMTPLFLIAVFLERGIEVFIKSWREINRTRRDRDLEAAEDEALQLADAPPEKRIAAARTVAEKRSAVDDYKYRTRRWALLSGLVAGLAVAAVGVRAIEPFILPECLVDFELKWLFSTVDIIITGGLIGGGSEGVHRIIMVVIDFADQTRKNIKQGSA